MFGAAVVQSVCLHQYFHRGFIVGMRTRTAIIAAIYQKALKLGNRARHSYTVGEIVNLMSVDAQRIMDFLPYGHNLWSSLFQIILSIFFLYRTMGASIFAGVGVICLSIPMNMFLASISKKYQVSGGGEEEEAMIIYMYM